MKVAKNYEKYDTVGEPYQAHGYWYTKINLNGQLTEVRLYNDQEYEKMYPSNLVKPYDALGFGPGGFITLLTGNTKPLSAWLRSIDAKYHKIFGWYIPCAAELPDPLAAGITPSRLDWSQVSSGQRLKPDQELDEIINTLIYGKSTSTFIGEVGDRITAQLTVLKTSEFDTKYGKAAKHIMEDADHNIYSWLTSSKILTEGQTYTIKGSVKAHETFRGEKQTVLSRCVVELPK